VIPHGVKGKDIVTALQTIKAKSAIERNYHIRSIASSQ
jgi:hypothetical protein